MSFYSFQKGAAICKQLTAGSDEWLDIWKGVLVDSRVILTMYYLYYRLMFLSFGAFLITAVFVIRQADAGVFDYGSYIISSGSGNKPTLEIRLNTQAGGAGMTTAGTYFIYQTENREGQEGLTISFQPGQCEERGIASFNFVITTQSQFLYNEFNRIVGYVESENRDSDPNDSQEFVNVYMAYVLSVLEFMANYSPNINLAVSNNKPYVKSFSWWGCKIFDHRHFKSTPFDRRENCWEKCRPDDQNVYTFSETAELTTFSDTLFNVHFRDITSPKSRDITSLDRELVEVTIPVHIDDDSYYFPEIPAVTQPVSSYDSSLNTTDERVGCFGCCVRAAAFIIACFSFICECRYQAK